MDRSFCDFVCLIYYEYSSYSHNKSTIDMQSLQCIKFQLFYNMNTVSIMLYL